MARIIDVIKSEIRYEGDNTSFVWKHPCEDFNTLSQLIVHESQEAVLFLNGQALDTFGPGRHTLHTNNIPLLRNLIGLATGGDSPFHCEVYFINKTVQMAMKWGTDTKVRFLDPNYGIPLEIGACGEMNLAVSDSKKLLVKVVGTTNGIAWGEGGDGFTKSLKTAFWPLVSTAVKAHLASSIKSSGINILEIDENLETLSEGLRANIVPGFEEYGLTIPQLYITNVSLPENDPNFKRMRELHTVSLQEKMVEADTRIKTAQAEAEAEIVAAKRKAELERQTTETEIAKMQAERDVIRAQAEAQATKLAGFAEADVMHAQGISGKDILQADVQKAYAEGIGNMGANGGGGGVIGEFVSLGVGMAAAGSIGSQMGDMFKGTSQPASEPAPTAEPEAKCAKCGAALPANAKFCLECGEKVVPPVPDGMIVCPECGKTVAKGKFCLECGYKFVTNCPKCGKETVPSAKFCPECGEKL